jgi:phosphoribosylanthranilate isomerase
MVRVKICGITNREDALCAVEHGADALGFIFYPGSRRYIPPDWAERIVGDLPPFVTPVGVFVNETRDRIRATAEAVGIRAIQLHGDEPPEVCRDLPAPVIRALRVGEGFEVAHLGAYPVGTFLLDTAREGIYGGTGETFDWEIAREAASFGYIILSGGLNPDNVTEAVRVARPYGVDCSSGVETEPGRKDHQKLIAFLGRAREAS